MRIYVGGLPITSKSDGLRDLFARAGTVTDANVIEDRYSGQGKGFGFVDMPDGPEARAAIARFDGCDHEGSPLKVSKAKPREKSGKGRRWP